MRHKKLFAAVGIDNDEILLHEQLLQDATRFYRSREAKKVSSKRLTQLPTLAYTQNKLSMRKEYIARIEAGPNDSIPMGS